MTALAKHCDFEMSVGSSSIFLHKVLPFPVFFPIFSLKCKLSSSISVFQSHDPFHLLSAIPAIIHFLLFMILSNSSCLLYMLLMLIYRWCKTVFLLPAFTVGSVINWQHSTTEHTGMFIPCSPQYCAHPQASLLSSEHQHNYNLAWKGRWWLKDLYSLFFI